MRYCLVVDTNGLHHFFPTYSLFQVTQQHLIKIKTCEVIQLRTLHSLNVSCHLWIYWNGLAHCHIIWSSPAAASISFTVIPKFVWRPLWILSGFYTGELDRSCLHYDKSNSWREFFLFCFLRQTCCQFWFPNQLNNLGLSIEGACSLSNNDILGFLKTIF